MGRHAQGDKALTPADKQARYRARQAAQNAALKVAVEAAQRSPVAPMARDDAVILAATARELERQRHQLGTLEAENERLRAVNEQLRTAAKREPLADPRQPSLDLDRCSYCNKHRDQLRGLAKGGTVIRVTICDECAVRVVNHFAKR